MREAREGKGSLGYNCLKIYPGKVFYFIILAQLSSREISPQVYK